MMDGIGTWGVVAYLAGAVLLGYVVVRIVDYRYRGDYPPEQGRASLKR